MKVLVLLVCFVVAFAAEVKIVNGKRKETKGEVLEYWTDEKIEK